VSENKIKTTSSSTKTLHETWEPEPILDSGIHAAEDPRSLDELRRLWKEVKSRRKGDS
jgi:hypothetical protein